MNRSGLAAIVGVMAGATAGWADPVQSDIATTLAADTWQWRNFVRGIDFDRGGVDSLEARTSLKYGITAKWNVELSVPWFWNDWDTSGGERESGLGDVALLVKRQVWKRDALQAQDRVALVGGAVFPTGEHKTFDALGRVRPARLSPGTGAFQFPAGVLFNHDSSPGLFADALYTFNLEGDGYSYGDTVRYDLGFTYAVLGGKPREHFLWAVLELNGEWAERDELGSARLDDTGGHVLWLSPGLRLVHWKGTVSVDLSYQFPVAKNLNGNQAGPRGSWLAGFRLNF